MAKAEWLGPGVFTFPKDKNTGKKSKPDLTPGEEFDSNDMELDRYNSLLDKGFIKGSKRNSTKSKGGAE